MVTVEYVIEELLKAPAPSRRLDAFVAQSVGWVKHNQDYTDPKSGETKQRVLWLVPSGHDFGTVPAYTSSIQSAYELSNQVAPEKPVAVVWEGERGRAMIEGGLRIEAATPAIALCAAALHTIRKS